MQRLLNDRLDWNLLRTFRVIGQEQSISRAAARLHLTQPAVSQALKRLEEQLGRQLIARRGPRFALTEVGEQIFALAGEIYGQMSQVSSVLEQPADEVIGKVRLLIISRIFSERFDDFLADWSSPASVSAVCPSTWWRRTSTPDCSGACRPTKGLPMSRFISCGTANRR